MADFDSNSQVHANSIARSFAVTLLLAGWIMTALSSYAQDDRLSTSSAVAVKAYRQAQIQLNLQNWTAASGFLLKALASDAEFAEASEMLGDIYRKQKKYEEALARYQKVLTLHPVFVSSALYGSGLCLFNLMRYGEAAKSFSVFLAGGRGTEKELKLAERHLSNAKFASEEIKRPVPFNPVNLGSDVNSSADEYLPSLTVDDSTLLFTRKQDNEDFYVSQLGAGRWGRARAAEGQLNTDAYNEGAGCISSDGRTLYCTLCGRPGVIGRCDIYYSKKVGTQWDQPKNLGPDINTEGWESQPSISADGGTLYFTSSRPGGYGGFDIWKTRKLAGGRWTKPENMGPDINTDGDEISPFIHPDGQTLYFSSDGRPGFGGKDLFIVRKNAKGIWGKAINLGFPINTSADESTLTVSSGGRKGYFASNNLKGYGGFDLYSFDLYEEARPHPVGYIKGMVTDFKTNEPVAALVEIISLKDGSVVHTSYADATSGHFLAGLPIGARYLFHVSGKGYLFYSGNLNFEHADTAASYPVAIALSAVALGGKDILRNIFFETDSYLLKGESKIELVRLASFLRANPSVSIELGGHTDNQGGERHNTELSKSRAKSVLDWLVRQGLAPSRFSYQGYGQRVPVASNLTAAGRALNRRTEFRITKI